MHITAPIEIKSVAWEGELVAPPSITCGITSSERPVATIGQPGIWTAAEALENQVGQKWVPPIGDASYWLLALAFTLREPSGLKRITEAQQMLSLRPQNSRADRSTAYAQSLFPDRLGAESEVEFDVSLEPELKFADGSSFNPGRLGAEIGYRKVFSVIQSYGVGESDPYWIFRRHGTYPLEGSQVVYAVVVAKKGADGIRASIELTATVDMPWGLAKFGLSEEATAYTAFTIP